MPAKPSLMFRNALANYVGRAWAILSGIIFTPVYLHYIGAEGFALVGIFASVQGLMAVFDFGIGGSLNRQVALLRAEPGRSDQIKPTIVTIAFAYSVIGILSGLCIYGMSEFLAVHWLRYSHLSSEQVQTCIHLMALSIVFIWINQIYMAALLGLEKHLVLNSINIVFSTIRNAGAVCVLIFVNKSPVAFFLWNSISSVAQLIFAAGIFFYVAPSSGNERLFRFSIINEIWKFSFGLSIISILSLFTVQWDKIILSRYLPLATFGYYTLAVVLAEAIITAVSPLATIAYPRFTALFSHTAGADLSDVYRRLCQIGALLLCTIAPTVAFQGKALIYAWTGNQAAAAAAAPILLPLALANMLNGLTHVPYMLELASGHVRNRVRMAMITLAVMVPGLALAIYLFGAVGSAYAWLIYNGFFVVIYVRRLHARFWEGAHRDWLATAFVQPVLAGVAAAAAVAAIAPVSAERLTLLISMSAGIIASAGSIILSSAGLRRDAWRLIRPTDASEDRRAV